MPKILIVAYACEPGRGGEGEIGWTLAERLARRHKVWVLTRSNNEPVHREAFRTAPVNPDLSFEYYDLPRLFTATKGRGKKNFLLYYYLWQLGSARAIRRLDAIHDFDVIHHLTGGMDWMPSGAALSRKPFIWGPVGSEDTHPEILRQLPRAARLKDRLRGSLRYLLRNLDPAVRLTRRRADVILSHKAESFTGATRGKVIPFVQTAIDPTPRMAMEKDSLGRSEILRVVYAGELIDWKGALLALRAFAAFHRTYPQSHLTMVGAGYLEARIREEIASCGLSEVVRLTGKLPMERLVVELNDADIFLYPSYHHGLATVVLQAMLTGLPVVCLAGDAIGRTVGQDAGITVVPSGSLPIPEALAEALLELATNEESRQRKAAAARTLARRAYSYDVLAARHHEIYESLVRTTDAPVTTGLTAS